MTGAIVGQWKRERWVWMPHAAHLIVGHDCRFHLATCVGDYIVSTVGEYWPDRQVREIHARIHDNVWLQQNRPLKGDAFDIAYMKRFGYETIGADRIYETMVFRAKRADEITTCCPYEMAGTGSVDFKGYNTASDAAAGHDELCVKWSEGGVVADSVELADIERAREMIIGVVAPESGARKTELLVSWLVAAGGMMREVWDELTPGQQEIITLGMCKIGLHLQVLPDVVRAVPDPRD